MTELRPPDQMTMERAGEVLEEDLAVADGRAREADRTFYDTFDGLLHAKRLELVHEGGRLALIEAASGRERTGVSVPAPTQPLLAGGLPPGALQDAVREVCGVRALLPLVHVHSHVRALRVLDDERKTVVRMSLEEPAVLSGATARTRLRPRLRIVPVRGYDKESDRVRRTLERDFGFTVAEQPLLEEALGATGGVPGGTSTKIDVALGYNQRADDAAVRVLRRLLEVIESNVDGTVADIDSEFLHDFRVSLRRTRAVQRELKAVFPAGQLQAFRDEFRWLQGATSVARDLDVYLLEFPAYSAMVDETIRPDLEPLLTLLRGRRAAAHLEMARTLRAERAERLFSEWSSFLERLVEMPADGRPDAARPIGVVAGEKIAKVYRRMTSMGDAIDESSPPQDYHELRKQGKELRYLLELFGAPLYPGEVVKPMVKTLKELQDVLGGHQDREVQVATLRSLRDEIAAADRGAEALMAMGALVQRLEEEARQVRQTFPERFAAFASKQQRHLVKDTFR